MDKYKNDIRDGLRDAVPITLGYFAVALSLGIEGKAAGLTPWQGFAASFLTLTSSGEFAGFTLIEQNALYLEILLMTLVVNARYLLMGASLSQKLAPNTPVWQRLLIGWGVTDEIFGVSVARETPITVYYSLAVILPSAVGWSGGTALGILMGQLLPARVVQALSVALFGMFLAVIMPPARKNRVLLILILLSFGLSYLFAEVHPLSRISYGNRIILLTVVLSAGAALSFPVREETEENHEA